MRSLLHIFSSRNYRLYFCGQLISLTGTWMNQTAIMWLVYQLTHSAFLLGLVGFIGHAPALLLSPFAGVWVDRLHRIRLLMATQVLSLIHSLLLAALVFSGHASFEWLAGLSIVQGIINAFEMPSRHILPVMLAEQREHLPVIISLNSSLFNLGRLIGPTLAGFVIAAWGSGFCFLLDGVSFLAVIFALLAMRLNYQHRVPHRRESVWKEMGEGFSYVWASVPLLVLLGVAGVVSIFGLPVSILLPAYAQHVFLGDSRTLGLLMSSFSAGAVIAAVFLASRSQIEHLNQKLGIGLGLSGLSLVAFSFSETLVLATVLLCILGFGCVLVVAAANTLVQNLIEERMRGRVMSIYGMAFQGTMPVGALLTGSLAQGLGLANASLVNGLVCLGIATWFFLYLPRLRAKTRPILEPEFPFDASAKERTATLNPVSVHE